MGILNRVRFRILQQYISVIKDVFFELKTRNILFFDMNKVYPYKHTEQKYKEYMLEKIHSCKDAYEDMLGALSRIEAYLENDQDAPEDVQELSYVTLLVQLQLVFSDDAEKNNFIRMRKHLGGLACHLLLSPPKQGKQKVDLPYDDEGRWNQVIMDNREELGNFAEATMFLDIMKNDFNAFYWHEINGDRWVWANNMAYARAFLSIAMESMGNYMRACRIWWSTPRAASRENWGQFMGNMWQYVLLALRLRSADAVVAVYHPVDAACIPGVTLMVNTQACEHTPNSTPSVSPRVGPWTDSPCPEVARRLFSETEDQSMSVGVNL